MAFRVLVLTNGLFCSQPILACMQLRVARKLQCEAPNLFMTSRGLCVLPGMPCGRIHLDCDGTTNDAFPTTGKECFYAAGVAYGVSAVIRERRQTPKICVVALISAVLNLRIRDCCIQAFMRALLDGDREKMLVLANAEPLKERGALDLALTMRRHAA